MVLGVFVPECLPETTRATQNLLANPPFFLEHSLSGIDNGRVWFFRHSLGFNGFGVSVFSSVGCPLEDRLHVQIRDQG